MPSETALTVIPVASNVQIYMPLLALEQAKERHDLLRKFVKGMLVEGVDYGGAGQGKLPSLRKPGAEKLCMFFGMRPKHTLVEAVKDWTGEEHGGRPLFAYTYNCGIWKSDVCLAEAAGHCNNWEKKYAYIWVTQDQIPRSMKTDDLLRRDTTVEEFQFAVDKAETTGPYGKPAEYWQMFRDAIASHRARSVMKATANGREYPAWQIAGTQFRMLNPDVYDYVNTCLKIAHKRAFVAAVLIAVNASDYFTQDLDDDSDTDADHGSHGAPPATDIPPSPPGIPHAADRSAGTGVPPPPAGAAPPASKPPAAEIDPGLKQLLTRMSKASREERLQEFAQMKAALRELHGDDEGEAKYYQILASQSDPVKHASELKSLGAAKKAITDLWNACQEGAPA